MVAGVDSEGLTIQQPGSKLETPRMPMTRDGRENSVYNVVGPEKRNALEDECLKDCPPQPPGW